MEKEEKTTKCPFCKKQINTEASICPYCNKNVGLYTLAQREPEAFRVGVVSFLIGLVVSYLIHTDFIRGGFNAFLEDPGCCLCLSTPILFIVLFLMSLYGLGGFMIGFFLYKTLKNKRSR